MVMNTFLHASHSLTGFTGVGSHDPAPSHQASSEPGIPFVVWEAIFWATMSTLSLPLGAILGILLSPVDEHIIAFIIAFGAGALLFAVTVELYGEQLTHLEEDGFRKGWVETACCLVAAAFGAIGYMYLNRWVEGRLPSGDVKKETPRGAEHRASQSAAATKFRAAVAKVIHTLRMTHISTRSRAIHHEVAETNGSVALAMLVGVVSDGIPEAILLGFMASEDKLSVMFVVALFVANFPESFSSASILHQGNVYPAWKIIGMWTVPLLVTALLAGLACWALPPWALATIAVKIIASIVEGIAGGMMLAMISSVMLPEAYMMAKNENGNEDRRDVPGVFCVIGFLCAVALKVYGGLAEEIF